MFATLMSFEKIIKRVQKEISSMLFKGAGVTVDIQGKGKAIIHVHRINTYEKSCLFWKGVLSGVLRMSKSNGEDVQVDSPSKEDCKFEVKWA